MRRQTGHRRQAVGVEFGKRREHALAADGADLATDWFDTGDAIEAHRQPGDVQQGLAADSAIGRKQDREETLSGAANPSSVRLKSSEVGRSVPRNNRRPNYCDGGMTSPDSVLTTAEDGLLIIRRTQNPPRPLTFYNSSIATTTAAKQRCDSTQPGAFPERSSVCPTTGRAPR